MMTPLEILYEWSRGCSVQQIFGGTLRDCEPCAQAAVEALRNAFKEEKEPHSASAMEAASDEKETQ